MMCGIFVCRASYLLMKKGGNNMATIAASIAVVAILFFAIRYIYKEKKKGKACIGCPYSDACPKHGGHSAGCDCGSE